MSEYDVGYAKPPTKHQFPKGKSGNPRGRPKGSQSISKMLERITDERVTIMENGKPLRLTKKEVALRQFVNKAMKGDIRALERFIAQLAAIEQLSREVEQRSVLALNPSQVEALRERLRIQATTIEMPAETEFVELDNA